MQEEEEKQKLQNDIRILTERLAKVNESLAKKMSSRNEFDKTIAETEAAYMKVESLLIKFLEFFWFRSYPLVYPQSLTNTVPMFLLMGSEIVIT